MCRYKHYRAVKLRVLSALLDFPNAVLAGVFTDCVSEVCAGAKRYCDLMENAALKKRGLMFDASASQMNKHEKTTIALTIRAIDSRDTS